MRLQQVKINKLSSALERSES